MTNNRQHLESCLSRSTRLTGTIAHLSQLKAKAAKAEADFDATVAEALGPELYEQWKNSQQAN